MVKAGIRIAVLSSMVKPTLAQVRAHAEAKAAEALLAARAAIGADRHEDVFQQGRFQAYREIAKFIAEGAARS